MANSVIKALDTKAGFALFGVLGVAAVGLFAYRSIAKSVKETGAEVAAAVDPTSDQNIFYQGVNKVGAVLSGNERFDLGSAIYDSLHGKPEHVGAATPPIQQIDSWSESNGGGNALVITTD